ncbi:MAG: DUF4395 domain-containing protein [bacterium]|nr:DUF4395 domain-containing protein [bacterium]
MKSAEVYVGRPAVMFCRLTVTAAVWAGFAFKQKEIILAVCVVLAASAILTIRNAPLIRVYEWTLGRFRPFKGKDMLMAVGPMRFAHSAGAILSGCCAVLVYLDYAYAWYAVLGFALLKSVSMSGLCPGEKLYRCLDNSQCCSILRSVKK